MKASKISIHTLSIECPKCKNGHLINNRNDSYDFEPCDINYGEVYYCGDCAQSSKIANPVVKRITGH